MNERIKSLIERAEYQAQKHSGSDWQVHVEPSREQIFEKFAELIVRECIEINKDLLHGEVEINSHRRSHNNALEESNFYIKRHFGVKE